MTQLKCGEPHPDAAKNPHAPLSPDRNPANVYLSSLAPSGRRTTAGGLAMVAREIVGFADPQLVPWHEIRYQHLAAIRTNLQEKGYSPATVNNAIYAIRGVVRSAFHLELIDAEAYERIRAVRPVRGKRLPAGRALTPGELSGLMDACGSDPTPAGVRDAAAIGLLYAGGLRRSEVAGLRLADYDPGTGELRVLGKGDKQRNVWIDNGAAEAMADWLILRGDAGGPLLLAINKGGVILDHGITDQAIYNLLRKRAREAGVRDCRCHDLRRSFISDLLDAGADISTVAKLAGHAQVQTSARYDRRGEDAKKKAVALLHLPYRRRQTPSTGGPGECPWGRRRRRRWPHGQHATRPEIGSRSGWVDLASPGGGARLMDQCEGTGALAEGAAPPPPPRFPGGGGRQGKEDPRKGRSTSIRLGNSFPLFTRATAPPPSRRRGHHIQRLQGLADPRPRASQPSGDGGLTAQLIDHSLQTASPIQRILPWGPHGDPRRAGGEAGLPAQRHRYLEAQSALN